MTASSFDFDSAVSAVRSGSNDVDSAAQKLLSELSARERLHLLDGDKMFWPGLHDMLINGYNRNPIVHGHIPRLKIPGIRFADGPRGCVLGQSTAFPVPMARGATWDVELEERIGLAVGRECRAQGANFFAGVCVNLPRHPAWGRIQETYGEDPVILGELGAALTRGVQRNMMACVKHYALNSMENARFQVDVDIDLAVLHEVFLPHFRRIIDEGVVSVMSSYNSVRGEFAGQNKELLIDILRDQWGFRGFVLSDFLFGLRDAALSVKNGLDIEAPFANLRHRYLPEALDSGVLSDESVDRACLNILRGQLDNAVRVDEEQPNIDVVFGQEHRDLAREAAVRSMVLLKNDVIDNAAALPLSSSISKVAVIGRLANSGNTGDRGSSAVRSPEVITPYEGIKAALKAGDVQLEDSNEAAAAKAAAQAAEAAIVVVGYDWRDEGEFTVPAFKTDPALKQILPPSDGTKEAKTTEAILLSETSGAEASDDNDNYGLGAGGDRASLHLSARDVEIIKAVSAVNKRTIVCIVAAGAVIMDDWNKLPASILYSWYSGSEGGHALADVLLGRGNFSGRLPFSIPRSESDLPFFDRNATKITYDQWFGQRLLDRDGIEAAYPLGFGLSYTEFKASELNAALSQEKETLQIRVQVSNVGSRDGKYVVQVYGTRAATERPKRVLLGFATLHIPAGSRENAELEVSTRPLQMWKNGIWEFPTGQVGIEVAPYSGSADRLVTSIDF
jgi:beta-glucosidase-like glycosyl hydrolase